MPAEPALTVTLGVGNRTAIRRRVAVEPWAVEYTLSPGEQLVIVATGTDAAPSFQVDEWDGMTQVHCDGAATFAVRQGDRELPAGYAGRGDQPTTQVRHLSVNPFA